MRFRTDIASRYVVAAWAAGTGVMLAGCDKLDFPVIRYDMRLEATAKNPESCGDTVDVAFEPVQIAPQVAGNLYQMTAFTYTANIVGKPVEDGPGNFECWFEYRSPALAPGKWKMTGEFFTGSRSCLREVGPAAPASVAIDQEEGCVEFKPPAADKQGKA